MFRGRVCLEDTKSLFIAIHNIALNFRGSKFSRIPVFKHFGEITLQIRCLNYEHAPNLIYYGYDIQAYFYLISTVTSLSA